MARTPDLRWPKTFAAHVEACDEASVDDMLVREAMRNPPKGCVRACSRALKDLEKALGRKPVDNDKVWIAHTKVRLALGKRANEIEAAALERARIREAQKPRLWAAGPLAGPAFGSGHGV